MIIVSQDKDLIVNFDNTTVIGIAQNNSKEIDSITVNGEEQFLAEYETEERAKEVLKEITKRCMLSERFKALSISDAQREMIHEMYDKDERLFIYEMPKE